LAPSPLVGEVWVRGVKMKCHGLLVAFIVDFVVCRKQYNSCEDLLGIHPSEVVQHLFGQALDLA